MDKENTPILPLPKLRRPLLSVAVAVSASLSELLIASDVSSSFGNFSPRFSHGRPSSARSSCGYGESTVQCSGIWWGLWELCGRRTWIRLSIIKVLKEWDFKSQEVLGERRWVSRHHTVHIPRFASMLAILGDPFTRIVSPQAGHCQWMRAVELSVPRNDFVVRVESQLRAAGLSDGVSEGSGEVWCGLCGDRRGWCSCGRCMGEGGFPTRPGLAGVKGKVGWARCKTCFGQKVVPCLFCGISEAPKWKLWLEDARRHPHRSRKQ